MAIALAEGIGAHTFDIIAAFGDFCDFCFRTVGWFFRSGLKAKSLRQLLPQLYTIGVASVPVVAITGGFIGMVMAIETFTQFKAIGQEQRIGSVIALSVLKQIGPVLAAVMLAGRVGGSLTAELGTMNVTEQLDALRVMGTDPIQYLVVPRVLACILLTPILTIYSDALGVTGGWFVSIQFLHVPSAPYWQYSARGVETWQIMEGIFKSVFFGGTIGLVACYKGFTCGSGASGVGRACTESFVLSFLAIIAENLIFAKFLQEMYEALYGQRSLFA